MTNLDSTLKSRDIILPTKVCLVKAMIFSVVIYGCESWTVKKAEHQRIGDFELFYDPAIQLLGIYSKRMKSGETAAFPHCSIIQNSPHM